MQNQGIESQDEHIHQDPRTRRRASVCNHWPSGRCLCSTAGNPCGCRTFHSNPCLSTKQYCNIAVECVRISDRRKQSHNSRPSTLQSRRSGCRTEGHNSETHSADHKYLHRNPIKRSRAVFRSDRVNRKRGTCQERD